MANNFEVSNLVAKTMGEFFVQKNTFFNTSNRKYVEQFSQKMYATGGTINIKIPGAPVVQKGLANTAQGIQDLVIPYTITESDIRSVTRQLSVYEEIFDILDNGDALTKEQKQAIVDNYAYPAYEAIAGQIEVDAVTALNNTAYLSPIDGVDVLGSINTFSSISQIKTFADQMKFADERYLVMNSFDAMAVANSIQNMFNESINKNITENARIGGPEKGHFAGFDMFTSVELNTHVAGALAGVAGIQVSSVAADGASIVLKNVTASTGLLVKAGDRISIPSVHLVKNITFQDTPYRLVVTAAADAYGDGAGNVSVTLSYPLMASGEHQNVDSLPAVNAAVDIFPDHKLNFAYVPSGLSMTPMRMPRIRGAENSESNGDMRMPVSVVIQGAALPYENVFRISNLTGMRAFAPYLVAIPSVATN